MKEEHLILAGPLEMASSLQYLSRSVKSEQKTYCSDDQKRSLVVLEKFEFEIIKVRFTLDVKVGNFRKWSLTSLAQNRPTTQNHICLSEVKQPLAKFVTG